MTKRREEFSPKEYLKNEKIQIFIRLAFTVVAGFSVVCCKIFFPDEIHFSILAIIIAPLLTILLNLLYLFIIKRFPYKFQIERIIVAVLIDITFTVYMMYLVDAFATYYAGALLWYSVAYGMRYNKLVAYTAYIAVLLSWLILITFSDFWREHLNFAIGWFFAYIVIPLYYFQLVSRLQETLLRLRLYAEESKYKAFHDHLTGASNRAQFNEDLSKFIELYNQEENYFALFFVDLDSFKEINDLYGHDIGDKVLIEAYRRLSQVIKSCYRLGGDEFVCIVKYRDEAELRCYAKKLIERLTMPCDNFDIRLSGSVGVARFPEDATNEFELKKRADIAMYIAKQKGKNCFCFYKDIA